jgi:putative DNA primase/helicase
MITEIVNDSDDVEEIENEIEPWPDPVPSTCIDDAVKDLLTHVHLNEDYGWLEVLWLLHSMDYHIWNKTPRLVITAPMKGCGKSTNLDVMVAMSDKAIDAGSCTPAAYVAYASRESQVFFIDEADLSFGKGGNPEMTRCLNTGYERGKPHRKTEPRGNQHVPVCKPVYSPAVLAGIALETKMEDATLDRSIIIKMDMAKKHQLPDPYKPKKHEYKFREHGRKLKRWLMDNREAIASEEPRFLPMDNFRLEDNFEPLLCIAQIHSEELADRVRRIAKELDSNGSYENLSLKAVADLHRWYRLHRDNLKPEWSFNICDKGIGPEAAKKALIDLHSMDADGEKPWENFHPDRHESARHIQARELTRLLKDVGVPKVSIRAGQSIYAYRWEDVERVYHQYFDDEQPEYVPGLDELGDVYEFKNAYAEASQRSSVVGVVGSLEEVPPF